MTLIIIRGLVQLYTYKRIQKRHDSFTYALKTETAEQFFMCIMYTYKYRRRTRLTIHIIIVNIHSVIISAK